MTSSLSVHSMNMIMEYSYRTKLMEPTELPTKRITYIHYIHFYKTSLRLFKQILCTLPIHPASSIVLIQTNSFCKQSHFTEFSISSVFLGMYSPVILKGITTIVLACWLGVFLTHSDLVSYKREGPFGCYGNHICALSNEGGKFFTQNLNTGLHCIWLVTLSGFETKRRR